MGTASSRVDHDLEELQRLRDEIRLKIHLAGMDAKSTWKELEPRVDKLERSIHEEGTHVADATLALARDLRKALEQFRSRLI